MCLAQGPQRSDASMSYSNRFNILSQKGSIQLGYTCIHVYHKYWGTLNTFRHAMPFKQSKMIFK